MLDLQARIHLQEEELCRLVVDEVLDGARRAVADGAAEQLRDLEQAPAQLRARLDKGAWRLFNDLLVSPLDGALALAKHDAVAAPVAKDLDLDVPRHGVVALQEDAWVGEERCSAADDAGEGGADLQLVVADLKALGTSAQICMSPNMLMDSPCRLLQLLP